MPAGPTPNRPSPLGAVAPRHAIGPHIPEVAQ